MRDQVLKRILEVEKDDASATLYVADLAGHENEKTTKVTGERMKELSFINTTLFHLREVQQREQRKGVHIVFFELSTA